MVCGVNSSTLALFIQVSIVQAFKTMQFPDAPSASTETAGNELILAASLGPRKQPNKCFNSRWKVYLRTSRVVIFLIVFYGERRPVALLHWTN